MASLNLDKLRKLADSKRAISTPIRTTQVTIRSREWIGGRRGAEPYVDTDLVLPARYKVRSLTSREITASGGTYETGDLRIGPITPPFTGGGYSEAQLNPPGDKATETLYVLTGDNPGVYTLVDMDKTRPIGWLLTIRRTRQTP